MLTEKKKDKAVADSSSPTRSIPFYCLCIRCIKSKRKNRTGPEVPD